MAQNEQLQAIITVDADTQPAQNEFQGLVKKIEELGSTGDKETRKFANQLKRVAIDAKAAGDPIEKINTQLQFSRAAGKTGITEAIEDLKRLRESTIRTDQALGKSAIQFNEYGLSAKQTTAALRQVPAQFTDIFVSLQGGQAPLTVLLQQGGQLKDIFGGIAPAARALGSYIVGLINPFTVLAASIAGLGVAYSRASKEAQEFNKTLVLSSNVLGTTVSELNEIAIAVDRSSSAITRYQAADFINQIAGSSAIAIESIERFTIAALEFERVGGGSAQEVAKNFAALAKEPARASAQLTQQLNYLTFETFKQIRALEEQGRLTDAAALAQRSYAEFLEKATPKIEASLSSFQKLWRGIKEEIKQSADNVVSLFRNLPDAERAAQLRARAANLERSRGQVGAEYFRSVVEPSIKDLNEQADALERKAKGDIEAARTESERIKTDAASIRSSQDKVKTFENEIAAIKAKIEASKLEQSLLSQFGLDAAKVLPSERELLKLQQLRANETNKETQQQLDSKILLQEQLVILDKLNQGTTIRLNEEKKIADELEKQAEAARKQEISLIRRSGERIRGASREVAGIILEGAPDDAQRYQLELEKLIAKKQEWISLYVSEEDAARAFEIQLEKLNKQYTTAGKLAESLGDAFANAFENAIITGNSLKDVLRDLERQILQLVTRQLVTDPLSKAISGALFSSFGGGSAAPIDIIDLSGIPGRAVGGPVSGNTMYLVGEKGPELFVPKMSGTVIPNDQLGGQAVSVVNNFMVSAPTDRRTQQQIAAMAGMSVQRAIARNT
jgi:phage-related minor tail protein